MKRFIKIGFIISAIFSAILFPILFLVKYDVYEPCLIIERELKKEIVYKYKNEKATKKVKTIYLENKVYDKLHDKKNIKIKNNKQIIQIKIDKWKLNTFNKVWYSDLNWKDDIAINELKIFIESKNILGF